MRPKDCAYIVEHLSVRFMAMVADHSRQLAEHRAAFGARTEADAKIIAGLRSEIGAARMAVLERDSLMSERDGLLTQVQDMRAEMERLRSENRIMQQDADDGYTEAIKVLGDPIALSKERDALRAEVAALKSQTPKQSHPVAVGGYLRRLTGFNTTPAGEIARVTLVDDDDASHLEYEVVRPNGEKGRWSAKGCEPCDQPATHDTEAGKAAAESALKTEPVAEEIKVGDVVEVVSNTGRNTWLADVGSVGTVVTVEEINDSISVHLEDVPGKKNALAGYVSFCDVRKVKT